jgi:hypothetical protein
MRCCLEIAGRFGLLALVFLTAVLLAVGIGAVTGGHVEKTADLSRPPPAPDPQIPGATVEPVGDQAQGENVTSGRPGSTSLPTLTPTSLVLANAVPNVLWSTPFVLLVLAIALLPLVPVAHHWWERNSIKLLLGLTLSAIVLAHLRPAATAPTAWPRVRRRWWRCSNMRASATSSLSW